MLANILKLISIAVSVTNTDLQSDQTVSFQLPEPSLTSEMTVEEALLRRRSVRDFENLALSLSEISQLMWAAQGITSPDGLRTAPSAGALYPLEIYLVVGNVSGLKEGVYKYKPKQNKLKLILDSDVRSDLARAALHQDYVQKNAALLVITGLYHRTTKKYGQRGIRYVHMEAGHAAQNIFLQATALNLSTVVVGAFDDKAVRKVLHISDQEYPLYLMPLGK